MSAELIQLVQGHLVGGVAPGIIYLTLCSTDVHDLGFVFGVQLGNICILVLAYVSLLNLADHQLPNGGIQFVSCRRCQLLNIVST